MSSFALETRTRREQVTEHLRMEILKGLRKPDSFLREAELSKEFGVSRGPIREAIRDLEKEGLVNVQPYAKTTVASVTLPQLLDVYELRSAIEKKAFELVWAHRGDDFHHEIHRRHNALLDAVGSKRGDAVVEAEQHFHGLPYEYCRNDLLLEFWRQISRRLRLCFHLHSEVFSNSDDYANAHITYTEMACGDSLDEMYREIDDHLSKGRALIEGAFSNTQK